MISELSVEYTKKRRDFSLPCQLTATPAVLLQNVDSSKREQALWTARLTTSVDLDCICELSEMKVNI